MGKSCRVKSSTKTHRKRKKVFCKKKIDIDESQDNVNTVNIEDIAVNSTNDDTNNTTNPTTSTSTTENVPPTKTVSERKIESISIQSYSEKITGYRLIDAEILDSVVSLLGCPDCKQTTLKLGECSSKKKGLATFMFICCDLCNYTKEFYTSSTQESSYDVNKRMIYAMRSCGQGYGGLETFTTLMNLPKPMTANNYDKLITKFVAVSKTVAEETMQDAIKEVRDRQNAFDDNAVVDMAISQDGSWQRRGHSSLNGCVAAISMDVGKVIDVEPMSRYCRGCQLHEPLKETDPDKYESWHKTHTCCYNYHGSAGGMETEGARRIFNRSLSKYNVQYTELYGDGDSKSHLAIVDTYPGVKVKKLQCVGHVQKRVGNRLLKLKKEEKGLGGKGKLTQSVIDRLQNYYGIAIRQNVGDLTGMQNATRATLFHIASSKDRNYHTAYCPEGKDSWCQYQKDQACGTNEYKPGPGLPFNVIKAIKPIFEELSSEKLLSGCLHGKTQNHNEAFNGTIWERLPKTKFVSLPQLMFGVYDAVANFNIGRKASVLVYEKMKMIPGKYMIEGCIRTNKRRISHSIYKEREETKKRRKMIRGLKKKKEDKNTQKEGSTYKAGAFC